MADGQMFEDQAAEAALRAFCEYLDAHPEIGLAWAMDKGDTLACEMKARFAPTARGRKTKPLRTFTVWADAQPDQDSLLPFDHPVFRWAETVGLPRYFVLLGWRWFEREFTTGKGKDKKQRDWLQHFDNSVRKRWGRLWYLDGNQFRLTADGQILAIEYPNEDSQ